MKKILVLLVLITAFALSAEAQRVKPKKLPLELLRTFRDSYPAAADIEWRKTRTGYQVKFESLGKRHETLYNKDSQWLSTRSVKSEAELAYPTVLLLQERFPDCVLTGIVQIDTPALSESQLTIQCNKTVSLLVFDNQGKLLREELQNTNTK